jgi:hypothetical protein
MTPQQAIELLNNATGLLNASRQDHYNIQNALKTLEIFIIQNDKTASLAPPADGPAGPASETTAVDSAKTETPAEKPKDDKPKK